MSNVTQAPLKFYVLGNNVKKICHRRKTKEEVLTVQIDADKYCPYCSLPVNNHEKLCPNCNLPVPDKNYRILDSGSGSGFVINVDAIIHNLEHEIEKPPPVSIKTALGNELIIKPILTDRKFVSCPLPYNNERRHGHCSLRKFTVIDFETANMYPDSVCQMAITVVEDNEIVWAQSWFIRPPYNDFRNEKIHGISLSKVGQLMTFAELWREIKPFIKNQLIGAYNAKFDIECLFAVADNFNLQLPSFAYFDILQNIREQTRDNKLSSYRLKEVARHFGIEHNPHEALSDAITAAKIQLECESTATDCFMYGDDDTLVHLFAGDVILTMARRQLKENFCAEDCRRLIRLIDIATRNGSDKAKCLKLQGEVFEKSDMNVEALESYERAYELNERIGVKARIQKLKKVLGNGDVAS